MQLNKNQLNKEGLITSSNKRLLEKISFLNRAVTLLREIPVMEVKFKLNISCFLI